MVLNLQNFSYKGKRAVMVSGVCLALLGVSGCSTNPATGRSQFTALMSPEREDKVGAQEHAKIIKQYGLYEDEALQAYVNEIGTRVTADTERPEVDFKFYIIDSAIVNAFALPGGYIYVSRGLLALANDEAELAAVLAHEAGHITGRHSAARYSRGVLTSLGANVASAVIGGGAAVSQAIGVGSNLYMSGYSRDQEREADSLGLRYMTRGGYDPDGMTEFLHALDRNKALKSKGKDSGVASYFSTHPPTPERVSSTAEEAEAYKSTGRNMVNRDVYLRRIHGLSYGDSAKQGFERDGVFYHSGIGFTFAVPNGFQLYNKPNEIEMVSEDKNTVIVFDFSKVQEQGQDVAPERYLREFWLADAPLRHVETLDINAMPAVTAASKGSLEGKSADVRAVAIGWGGGHIARFQIAALEALSEEGLADIHAMAKSFRRLGAADRYAAKPIYVSIEAAKAGDSVSSMAARQKGVFDDALASEQNFRVLNGLKTGEEVVAGRIYKVIR